MRIKWKGRQILFSYGLGKYFSPALPLIRLERKLDRLWESWRWVSKTDIYLLRLLWELKKSCFAVPGPLKKKSPRNWNVKYCLWSNYFEHFFTIFESNNSRAACALGCTLSQQMLGGVMCMVQWIEYRIKSLNLWSGIGLHYVSWIFHTSETGVFWSTLGHLLLVQDLKLVHWCWLTGCLLVCFCLHCCLMLFFFCFCFRHKFVSQTQITSRTWELMPFVFF